MGLATQCAGYTLYKPAQVLLHCPCRRKREQKGCLHTCLIGTARAPAISTHFTYAAATYDLHCAEKC